MEYVVNITKKKKKMENVYITFFTFFGEESLFKYKFHWKKNKIYVRR